MGDNKHAIKEEVYIFIIALLSCIIAFEAGLFVGMMVIGKQEENRESPSYSYVKPLDKDVEPYNNHEIQEKQDF